MKMWIDIRFLFFLFFSLLPVLYMAIILPTSPRVSPYKKKKKKRNMFFECDPRNYSSTHSEGGKKRSISCSPFPGKRMWGKKEGGGLLTCFVAAVECVRWKKVKVAHYGLGGNGGRQKPEIAMEGEREP